MTDRTREDQLAMMGHPGRWIHWPRLPLRRGDHVTGDVGYIVECTTPYVVILDNIFNNLLPDTKRIEYQSFEAILDDGWEVD